MNINRVHCISSFKIHVSINKLSTTLLGAGWMGSVRGLGYPTIYLGKTLFSNTFQLARKNSPNRLDLIVVSFRKIQ